MPWMLIKQVLSLPDAGIELTMRLHVLHQTVLSIPCASIFLAVLHYDLALACEVVVEMRQFRIYLFLSTSICAVSSSFYLIGL